MPKDDSVRLRHMLEAAREALSYAEGKTRTDLDGDRPLVLALVKLIEIIGEAALHVSPQAQATCPSIPWPEVIGMRHRLVHAYFEIKIDRVWDTVKEDLPPLVAALERIVPEE